MHHRSFDNQRQAIIAALKALGRPAKPKEVAEYLATHYSIAADCGTLMADMEVNGKSTYPATEKILHRVGRGLYSL
jgi:hypothetical protein